MSDGRRGKVVMSGERWEGCSPEAWLAVASTVGWDGSCGNIEEAVSSADLVLPP